ncbi:MAG: tetratricopeptide repeat protein [Acidobacteriota bacterium]
MTRAGIDPIATIHVMEDHDRAFDIWREAGVRDRILVHFDGHLDFSWIADRPLESLLAASSSSELDRLLAQGMSGWNLHNRSLREQVHYGNYIYAAMREGVVGQFYWVMPDPFWATQRARRCIQRSLEQMARQRPADAGPIEVLESGLRMTVLGRPLVACTLQHLPRFKEPVLLDLDVDYFLTPPEENRMPPGVDMQPAEPWLRPAEFLRRLAKLEIPTDLVTIAYSVGGFHTPLRFRFYGDIVHAALTHPNVPVGDRPFEGSAAEAYAAALAAIEAGDLAAARLHWAQMSELDPCYRTPEAIPGRREEAERRWRRALQIYETMIEVDPTWSEPQLGQGRVLWRLGQYDRAESSFREARRLAAGATQATYWMGRCAARRGQWVEAEQYWTEAVAQDPRETFTWQALAELAARRGDSAAAIANAERSIAAGSSASSIHRLMDRQARRLGRRRLARRELRLWMIRLLEALRRRSLLWRRRLTNRGGSNVRWS